MSATTTFSPFEPEVRLEPGLVQLAAFLESLDVEQRKALFRSDGPEGWPGWLAGVRDWDAFLAAAAEVFANLDSRGGPALFTLISIQEDA